MGVGKDDQIVLTDAHGVEDTIGPIMMEGANGKWYSGTIVKLDDVLDIAAVKVNGLAKGVLPEVELADSDNTQPGDLVFGSAHDKQSKAITIHGGTYEGLTTKALQAKRLDAIYQNLTPNNPSNYYQTYVNRVNALQNPGDRRDAATDFQRTLLETHCGGVVGNSGGSLFNLDGKVIGIQEAVSAQTDIGTLGHDTYTPVGQVKAFLNAPQKFRFQTKTAQFRIDGSAPQSLPVLAGITRLNGESRLPYNMDDLLIEPEHRAKWQSR